MAAVISSRLPDTGSDSGNSINGRDGEGACKGECCGSSDKENGSKLSIIGCHRLQCTLLARSKYRQLNNFPTWVVKPGDSAGISDGGTRRSTGDRNRIGAALGPV